MSEPIKQGEIYIYKVTFVDGKEDKSRPVLVTSQINSKGDVIGIPGSSKIENWYEPYQFVVTPEDLAEGKLEKASVFPASKQMVFSPRFFAVKVSALTSKNLKAVLRITSTFQVEQFNHAVKQPKPFVPDQSVILPSDKVFGAKKLQFMVETSLDGWLTIGRFNGVFVWLVKFCSDALGTTYNGKPVDIFGDVATISFYPAYHSP
jgi:CDP-6-deoxy-D-xylo-4-hexulose-3-dehydrase